MKAQAIPKGYHTLNPYINVKDAPAAIEFYKNAFGAKETGRITMPDGSVGHSEIKIGDSILWISEENAQWGNRSPKTLGGSPVCLCLYVDDVDAMFSRALKAGAKVTGDMEPKGQFYGDRVGTLTDPFGHQWSIMTHIEDVSIQEMQKRLNEMYPVNK